MLHPIYNPTPPLNSEYQIAEIRLYEELLNNYNSPDVVKAYIKEIPNIRVVPAKKHISKLEKFRKAGLIGCLNDTGLTSENYKSEFYKDKS